MTSRSLKSALLSRERFIFKIANFRYGSLFDISSAGVLFYVSFHYCVLPCPGGGPGQGVTEVRHPSAFIFIHFHSFSDFHMLNIFKCSLPDTTQINQCSLPDTTRINQEARLLQGMQTELLLRGMGRSLLKAPLPAFQNEW